jgi:glycogen operon protein
MLWFAGSGLEMSLEDWHNPERRTLQRLSYHLMNDGSREGLLLIVNGREQVKEIVLPQRSGVNSFELLWDSSLELPPKRVILYNPGSKLRMVEASIQLLLVR